MADDGYGHDLRARLRARISDTVALDMLEQICTGEAHTDTYRRNKHGEMVLYRRVVKSTPDSRLVGIHRAEHLLDGQLGLAKAVELKPTDKSVSNYHVWLDRKPTQSRIIAIEGFSVEPGTTAEVVQALEDHESPEEG